MVPLELPDVGLAARDLAPGHALTRPPRRPGTLPRGQPLRLLLHLLVELRAGARDEPRQEVGADQPGVPLPDPGRRRGTVGRVLRGGVGIWVGGAGGGVVQGGGLLVPGGNQVVVDGEVEEVAEVPDGVNGGGAVVEERRRVEVHGGEDLGRGGGGRRRWLGGRRWRLHGCRRGGLCLCWRCLQTEGWLERQDLEVVVGGWVVGSGGLFIFYF